MDGNVVPPRPPNFTGAEAEAFAAWSGSGQKRAQGEAPVDLDAEDELAADLADVEGEAGSSSAAAPPPAAEQSGAAPKRGTKKAKKNAKAKKSTRERMDTTQGNVNRLFKRTAGKKKKDEEEPVDLDPDDELAADLADVEGEALGGSAAVPPPAAEQADESPGAASASTEQSAALAASPFLLALAGKLPGVSPPPPWPAAESKSEHEAAASSGAPSSAAAPGRLVPAAVEGAAHAVAVGPSDVPGLQLPLEGIDEAGFPPQASEEWSDCIKDVTEGPLIHLNKDVVGTPLQIPSKLPGRGGIRNRKLALLTAELKVDKLHDFIKDNYQGYVVASTGAETSMALLVNVSARRVAIPAGIHAALPSCSLSDAISPMLRGRGECFTTLRPAQESKTSGPPTGAQLIEMMRPYLAMNPAEFEAELWSLQLRDKASLTSCEVSIVEKPVHAKAVRQALINLEASKAFVRFVSDQKNMLELADLQNLDGLVAVTLDIDSKSFHAVPLLAALPMLELYTFVLIGDAGLGKTALARALAALQCKARGLPYYIESNTPDSLRGVCINGFFRPHVPVILDEWRPEAKASFGAGVQSREMLDTLKCLTSVDDGATIKCRYSDIKFAPGMPRLMTANCRTLEDWMQVVTEAGGEADYDAVLRRCLFVEVDRQLVSVERQATYKAEKGDELADMQAAVLHEQGLTVPRASFRPVARQGGRWQAIAPQAIEEAAMWSKLFESQPRRF
jgi:hypothetical protein